MTQTPPSIPSTDPTERIRIVVRDGGHLWRFTYAPGDVHRLVTRVSEMARDPDCPLTWSAASRVIRAASPDLRHD